MPEHSNLRLVYQLVTINPRVSGVSCHQDEWGASAVGFLTAAGLSVKASAQGGSAKGASHD
jgi:hypothetical protein